MPDLASLSNDQLEDLWCETCLTCDADLSDAVVLELMKRPDFCPHDYELQWEMEDQGWNGGASQEDRDAR